MVATYFFASPYDLKDLLFNLEFNMAKNSTFYRHVKVVRPKKKETILVQPYLLLNI